MSFLAGPDDPASWPRRRRGPPWRRHRRSGWRPGSGEPLRRDLDGRLLGGAAAGVARWRGWNPTTVRVAFALITVFTTGTGVALYVAAWLLVPDSDQTVPASDQGSIWHKAKSDSLGIALALGVASMLTVLLFLLDAVSKGGWLTNWLWPQVASIAGLILIWRNAGPAEQASLRRLAEPIGATATGGGSAGRGRRGRRVALRLAVSLIMLVSGLGWLVSARASLALLRPLVGVALVLGSVVLFLGPWWLRIARDLVVERSARERAEERAEIATRVHDSVLQTLALIQRRATDPQQVVQIARSQERELRSWLFEGKEPGDGAATTFAGAVQEVQQDVEARYKVPVEVVTVGDCDLDDDLTALLGAGREAAVNAAKWSGASVISLFAEVEPGRVALIVRDKGKGFDTETVPSDRKGLAESVRGRMARHGGTASVVSAPGEGTKVTVTMPRSGAVAS
jgi:signal transduction histidine kinase/phage shock protein PspC (stress-responsive transcriptional regulator)